MKWRIGRHQSGFRGRYKSRNEARSSSASTANILSNESKVFIMLVIVSAESAVEGVPFAAISETISINPLFFSGWD